MKTSDVILFTGFGAAFWIVGTWFYQKRGTMVFEAGAATYWANFVATPIISTVVCLALIKLRHVPVREWAWAGLLLALPGMFGEALILSNFARWMPQMRLESGGKYGAFLFATYALFLTIVEIISLAAR
jgi:Family of unknown function (DUF5367)